MNLEQTIEAILFASGKPLSERKLGEITEKKAEEISEALDLLESKLEDRGILLQRYEKEVALVSHPEAAEFVQKVVKDEEQGELTRASLEALTILAYRGPMTRPELEQIRGVQSSMILRNLMIRGLIEQKEDMRLGQATYAVTFDFLNHLGLKSIKDLPDYDELRGHTAISDMLDQLKEPEKTDENQDGEKGEELAV
ncbi:MAG: SMC-Scp complex subunit ScpB [Patescibacteria group bacterium]|nr:SMC-Scp complex subunit ScpB [Patescibacteria group bacterium]